MEVSDGKVRFLWCCRVHMMVPALDFPGADVLRKEMHENKFGNNAGSSIGSGKTSGTTSFATLNPFGRYRKSGLLVA